MKVTVGDSIVYISREDAHLLNIMKWWVHKSSGYLVCKLNGKFTAFHRMILNFPKNQVDHINRNRLDNRRKNLRVVEPHINNINKGIQRNNRSGFKGVHYLKKNMCWVAYIGKTPRIYIGSFKNIEEAAAMYDVFNKILYGTYGVRNN